MTVLASKATKKVDDTLNSQEVFVEIWVNRILMVSIPILAYLTKTLGISKCVWILI